MSRSSTAKVKRTVTHLLRGRVEQRLEGGLVKAAKVEREEGGRVKIVVSGYALARTTHLSLDLDGSELGRALLDRGVDRLRGSYWLGEGAVRRLVEELASRNQSLKPELRRALARAGKA